MKCSDSCSKGLDLVREVKDSFLEVATWLGLRDGWNTQNEEGGGTFQKEAACVQQEGARKHKGRREIRVARGSREGAEWKQLDEPEATVEGLIIGYGSLE